MPFECEYDPKIHCRTCKGFGSIRFFGEREEHSCGFCYGSGMKRDATTRPATSLLDSTNSDLARV